MKKVVVVIVAVIGLIVSLVVGMDMMKGIKNIFALNHYQPTENISVSTEWHQDLSCCLHK